MLLGEHIHTLDEKKRLSLPARFRSELGKRIVLTRGLDGCLFVYSDIEWQKFSTKLTEMPLGQADSRAFNRFMLSGAIETDIDSAGRILIPDFLRDFAKLGSQVVVSGVGSRVELWNSETWKAYTGDIESKADLLAEKLGDIGMI
jgi:MraZ protein